MSTVAVQPRTHIAPLDGLRGIAILAVVFHNTVEAVAGSTDPLARGLTLLAGPGWLGVQLFFALSGFLIVGELLDHRDARNYVRTFYARRALRILPLYWATLVLVLALTTLLGAPAAAHYLREEGWRLGLFVNNFTPPPPGGLAHLWSLAVEAQFYALAPWIVARSEAPRLAKTWICIAVGVLAVRTAFALAGNDAWTIYTGMIFRLDALALGAAGACFARIESTATFLRKHSGGAFLLAAAILLSGAHATHSYDYSWLPGETYGYTLAAIACALVVAFAGAPLAGSEPRRPWIRWLSVRPLRLIGRYSFGIYIFHGLLNRMVGMPLVQHRAHAPISGAAVVAYSAAVFIVSLILATLSYELFEIRFLRVKPSFRRHPATTDAARESLQSPATVNGGHVASSRATSPVSRDAVATALPEG